MGEDYVFYKDTEESRALLVADAAAKTTGEEAKGHRATEGSAELDRKAPIEESEETEENTEAAEEAEKES